MRGALLLLLPCGTALAEPPLDHSQLLTARIGVTELTVPGESRAHKGNALTGELAFETWMSPQSSITLFVDHARRTVVSEYYGTYTYTPADLTETGVRIGYHPSPRLVYGVGLGVAAYREHGESVHGEYGQFFGLFTDITVFERGSLAIVLGGRAELGPAPAAAATLGVGWLMSGTTREHEPPPDPLDDNAYVTLRAGAGHAGATSEDNSYDQIVPAGEIAIGTPIGELGVGATYFDETYRNGSGDVDDASIRLITTSLRHRSHIMRRVTIAWGGGIMSGRVRDRVEGRTYNHSGLLVDMVVSIRLARSGPLSLEVFDRLAANVGGFGEFGGSSLFGLAVGYH